MITLQFSTERGFGSQVIRYVTNDEFSHVDCVLPADVAPPGKDGWLLGARMNGGVQIRKPFYDNFTRIAQYTCDLFNPDQEKAYYGFLFEQVGKPYDRMGILNLALHMNHDWRKGKSWFCSALQDAASIVAEQAFLMGDPNKFSPRDLTLSPKLKLKFDQLAPFAIGMAAGK